MSDIESPPNTVLHDTSDHDSTDYKRKYTKLKQLFIAITCLLCGLFVGSIISRLFNYDQATTKSVSSSPETIPLSTPYINDDHEKATPLSMSNTNLNQQPLPPKVRPNDAECSMRRCCHFRDGVTQQMLPPNFSCYDLTDSECGENDNFCEWDCNPPLFGRNGITRTFKNISFFEGEWEEPDDTEGEGNDVDSESFTNCLQNGKLIAVDDCGVEYDEQLDDIELAYFCRFRQKYDASFEDGHDKAAEAEGGDEEDEDPHRRLVVLGPDDRTQVTSTNYPFSSVLYLMHSKPSGGNYRCTATMISPRWAITSAHCMWGNGDWYGNWRLYKDVRSCSDRKSSNKYKVDKKMIFTEYMQTRNADHDIGLLRLTEEPDVGYLDFGYNSELEGTVNFNIIQYPADKSDCTLWRQYCPFDEWSTYRMVTHECDTYGGSSGSAYYRYWSSSKERIIFGIHRGGKKDSYNHATRITSSKYNTICEYLQVDHPGHCDNEHNSVRFA